MSAFLFLLIMMTCDDGDTVDSPYTQRLIAAEVRRLGGETEAPEEIVFVAFRRERFLPEHFEMLRHLDHLRWFSCKDVVGTADSFQHLRHLKKLRRIDIRNSPTVVDGLVHLGKSKSLEELWLENVTLSEQTLDVIEQLPSIKSLHLEKVQLTENGIARLAKMAARIDIDSLDLTGVSEETILMFERELRRIESAD